MPYAATVTVRERLIQGERYFDISITETGNTGTSDEAEITGIPTLGTVTHVDTTLTTGSGSTATQVDPQIGEATNSNSVYENATAGTTALSGTIAKTYVATGNKLYWRAKANGTLGTGGQVVSRVTIKAGHHPI